MKRKSIRSVGSTSPAAAGKSRSASKTKSPPGGGAEFASVFAKLRNVMAAHAQNLEVTADEPKKFYLVTKAKSWKGGPMFFGAVIWGKTYVSYHLMPLYMFPELKRSLSPELKRRMQGKSCFNFHRQDESLIAELSELTKSGVETFRDKNYL